MIWDTGPVAFANSKQRFSTTVIKFSYHSWTSLYPVWWSVAVVDFSIRLPHHGACLQPGGSSRVTVVTFGNSSRAIVDSSNLFAAPREAATKFSPVHLPLKRLVSRTPLHNAHILNLESEMCASQTIGSHLKLTHRWWAPRDTNSCLHSQETIHFLLGTLMLVGKKRGELHAGRNLVLRFEKGKKSDESRISDDRRRSSGQIYRAVHPWRRPAEPPPAHTDRSDGRDRGHVSHPGIDRGNQ